MPPADHLQRLLRDPSVNLACHFADNRIDHRVPPLVVMPDQCFERDQSDRELTHHHLSSAKGYRPGRFIRK
jgi:hypothetical protein